jgi:hypothetical protein
MTTEMVFLPTGAMVTGLAATSGENPFDLPADAAWPLRDTSPVVTLMRQIVLVFGVGRKEHEILGSVIRFVAIQVMHALFPPEVASEFTLHHQSVLKYIAHPRRARMVGAVAHDITRPGDITAVHSVYSLFAHWMFLSVHSVSCLWPQVKGRFEIAITDLGQ